MERRVTIGLYLWLIYDDELKQKQKLKCLFVTQPSKTSLWNYMRLVRYIHHAVSSDTFETIAFTRRKIDNSIAGNECSLCQTSWCPTLPVLWLLKGEQLNISVFVVLRNSVVLVWYCVGSGSTVSQWLAWSAIKLIIY